MRITMKVGVLGLLLLLSAAAPADDWKLERERDGITVQTRAVEGSKFREFRGEAVIDAELNQLMALMDDTKACVDWMFNCKNPQLLWKVSLLDRYQYLANDFPWPAADRDMIVRNHIQQNPRTRAITVTLEGAAAEALPEAIRDDLPTPKDHVRVTELKGFFEFTPLDGERTRVVYQLHLDPVGALPSSLVNSMIVDNPFETLKAMREVVKRPQYRCFRPF